MTSAYLRAIVEHIDKREETMLLIVDGSRPVLG
jgi:hypothetical protein